MSVQKYLVGFTFLVAAALVPLTAAPADTQAAPAPITIKLATQAPTGTIWEKELRNLGATWVTATAKRVSLSVYPDGSQGTESASIDKMRTGGLQAALLTAGGLSDIDKAFNVFTIPFFFENDAEEQAVQTKLEPMLEQALNAKGFHFLCWGTGGWVEIFSKKPLHTLADVKAANIYVSADDVQMRQWYTDNGFHPKALGLADIATQLRLQNGMIDTTPDTPYLALLTQIYGNAKYMLNIRLAPLVGAMIVTTKKWQELSPADQAKMTDAARQMQDKIRQDTPKEDDDSIKAMQGRGLQVISPDAKATQDFHDEADKLGKTMRGPMVPANVYDLAAQERDAVRNKKAPASK